MSNTVGVAVGEKQSKVIDWEGPATGQIWSRFLKVRILLDIEQPLWRGTYVNNGLNRHFVALRYEKLSDFCYCCGKLDHMDNQCPLNYQILEPGGRAERAFEPWLRSNGPKLPPLNVIERKVMGNVTRRSRPDSIGESSRWQRMLTDTRRSMLDRDHGRGKQRVDTETDETEEDSLSVIRLGGSNFNQTKDKEAQGNENKNQNLALDTHIKLMGSFGRLRIPEDLEATQKEPNQIDPTEPSNTIPLDIAQAIGGGIPEKTNSTVMLGGFQLGTGGEGSPSSNSANSYRRGHARKRGSLARANSSKQTLLASSTSSGQDAKKPRNWEMNYEETDGDGEELWAAVGAFQPRQDE